MKARPILFSAPMVVALLGGRKRQTRRVVKGVALDWLHAGFDPAFVAAADNDVCPYGKPGDLLWMRETAETDEDACESVVLAKYTADGAPVLYPGPAEDEHGEPDYGGSHAHWWYSKPACPSIHLPRRFSRLTLEITGVRVERLQDISEADKVAEGGTLDRPFGTVWRAINTAPGIRWEDNPWVWVLEFKVHRCNVDDLLKVRAA